MIVCHIVGFINGTVPEDPCIFCGFRGRGSGSAGLGLGLGWLYKKGLGLGSVGLTEGFRISRGGFRGGFGVWRVWVRFYL